MGGTPRSTHGQEARNPEKAPVSPLPHRRNGRLESVRLAQQHESISEIPAATQMKRRIFGLENEYGLTCTLNGERRLSPDNVARYLFEKVIPGAHHANVFLENGARLYLDTGFHPSTRRPSAMTSLNSSSTTRQGSGSSTTSGTRPRSACRKTALRGISCCSRTTRTRITSSAATCHFSAWPTHVLAFCGSIPLPFRTSDSPHPATRGRAPATLCYTAADVRRRPQERVRAGNAAPSAEGQGGQRR